MGIYVRNIRQKRKEPQFYLHIQNQNYISSVDIIINFKKEQKFSFQKFSFLSIQINLLQMEKKTKIIDLEAIIQKLIKNKEKYSQYFALSEEQVDSLSHFFKLELLKQPMLLQLNPPLVVCGDIHGQFKDLLNIFATAGQPCDKNYLFLGDYVDRGKKSLECICLMMAYKIKYSKTFFMLRGNHECERISKIYGFYDECKRKLNVKVWKNITEAFKYLPIAAVIGQRIFCVHGGISPLLKQLETINSIKRPIENQGSNLITDMLWADPNPISAGWQTNFDRGVSYTFGKDVIDTFLKKHELDFICRSHQVVEEGYEFFNQRKLLTIFSAPNYCGQFLNLGGILIVGQDLECSIQQIKGLDHFIARKVNRASTPMNVQRSEAKFKQKYKNGQISPRASEKSLYFLQNEHRKKEKR